MVKIKLLVITVLFLLTVKTVSAATIKINEFYSAGSSSNPDWVEVYYDGVDITLYQLKDTAGNTKNLSDGSYGGNFATVDWSNRLNNDGDTIKLVLIINPDSPLDQVTYGGSGDISVPNSQQSAGRNPDGTGNWTIFSTSSKGSTNNTSPTSAPTPTPTSTPTPTPSPNPTPTNTPSPTKTPTPTPTPTPKKSASPTNPPPTLTPTPIPTPKSTPIPETSSQISYRIASVAGAQIPATPEAKVEVKDQKQINPFFWAGLIFIFAGVSILGYIYLKKNAKIHIPFRR